MENQHRKITGYRDLNQEEIDLMNEVEALGVEMEDRLIKVQRHIENLNELSKTDEALSQRIHNAEPWRFSAIAKTDFQTGLMALTRAVAQPEFF